MGDPHRSIGKRTSDTYKMEGLGVNINDQEGHNITIHVEYDDSALYVMR